MLRRNNTCTAQRQIQRCAHSHPIIQNSAPTMRAHMHPQLLALCRSLQPREQQPQWPQPHLQLMIKIHSHVVPGSGPTSAISMPSHISSIPVAASDHDMQTCVHCLLRLCIVPPNGLTRRSHASPSPPSCRHSVCQASHSVVYTSPATM